MGNTDPWRSLVGRAVRFGRNLVGMIKGYQGNELWPTMNPSTGKRQIVDPEGEFIPGETIIKLYYRKRVDSYVTVPGDSMFKVTADGYTLEVIS